MPISVGESLPNATFLRMGDGGPESIELSSITAGRSVVLFGLPGPFTGTCTDAHVPSFMRTRGSLGEAGVDDVICFAVTDPFVMKAWSEATGAEEAGVRMLADSDGAFTKAIGLDFDAPPVGFYGRTVRHAMHVQDGVVKILNLEETHGVCEATAGETMLAMIQG